MRIVSLVPSITESLFDLQMGPLVVGRTTYCIHPESGVANVPTVGGTKTLDVEAIAALEPTLVLANREENRREQVERMQKSGLRVEVTYPRTPADVEGHLRALATIAGEPFAVNRATELTTEIRSLLAAPHPPVPPRVACLIWKNPYMAVSDDTYAGALIRAAGGVNVFGASDARYPRVSLDAIASSGAQLVLMPSEPYRFAAPDRAELLAADVPQTGHAVLYCGEDLTWWGVRTPRALRELRALFARLRV